METEEPELWKKARKPVPCSKDEQYHVKVEKSSFLIERDKENER